MKPRRRWGVRLTFRGVFGALKGAGGGDTPGSRLRRRSRRAISPVRRAALAARTGWRASEARAYPTSSKSVGTLSGRQGGSGSGITTGSGVRSRRFTVISIPDTPSMAAW